MQMQMLAALNGGSSVQGALNRSDIPPVDLSGAAASNAGIGHGSGDLKIGGGGAPVQGGGKGGGLAGIGGGTGRLGHRRGRRYGDEGRGPDGRRSGRRLDGDRSDLGRRSRHRRSPRALPQLLPDGPQQRPEHERQGPHQREGRSERRSVERGCRVELAASRPPSRTCIAGVVKRATFSAPGGGGSTLADPGHVRSAGQVSSTSSAGAGGTRKGRLERPFRVCDFRLLSSFSNERTSPCNEG